MIVDKEIVTGLADANYTLTPGQLADVVVPPIQKFFSVRDAAVTEARERAIAARDAALMMLGLSGLIVTVLLGLIVGVTMLLRRRVIAPIVTLTQRGRRNG